MNIFSGTVVYILIWWVVLFCTLPLGVNTIVKPKGGAMPGAPVNPHLKRKLLLTTIIATLLWFVACAIITSSLVSFHDMSLKMTM